MDEEHRQEHRRERRQVRGRGRHTWRLAAFHRGSWTCGCRAAGFERGRPGHRQIKILQNASLDTAASVAGAVCNIDTAQATSLAQRATAEGSTQTVCNLPGGVVTFSQAGSVNSGAAPAPAPAAGTPSNPISPVNPMYPSEQQPQLQPR